MRAFSVQECNPFDGALPAAYTPRCADIPVVESDGTVEPSPELRTAHHRPGR